MVPLPGVASWARSNNAAARSRSLSPSGRIQPSVSITEAPVGEDRVAERSAALSAQRLLDFLLRDSDSAVGHQETVPAAEYTDIAPEPSSMLTPPRSAWTVIGEAAAAALMVLYSVAAEVWASEEHTSELQAPKR